MSDAEEGDKITAQYHAFGRETDRLSSGEETFIGGLGYDGEMKGGADWLRAGRGERPSGDRRHTTRLPDGGRLVFTETDHGDGDGRSPVATWGDALEVEWLAEDGTRRAHACLGPGAPSWSVARLTEHGPAASTVPAHEGAFGLLRVVERMAGFA